MGALMPKDSKGLGYLHQVSMITTVPSKASSEPPKECNRDDQTEEGKKQSSLLRYLQRMRKGQATQDELLQVNLGSDEEPRPTLISGNMSPEKKNVFLAFLKQN